MEGRAPRIETALLDIGDVSPDELWWTGDTVLSQLVRELVEDARRRDGESIVAAFNSSL
jgi:FXSXX-COOH protein